MTEPGDARLLAATQEVAEKLEALFARCRTESDDEGTWGLVRESDLVAYLRDALLRDGSAVFRREVPAVGLGGAWPAIGRARLGGFDAGATLDGQHLLFEFKWLPPTVDKLHELLWDVAKLALAVGDPSARDALGADRAFLLVGTTDGGDAPVPARLGDRPRELLADADLAFPAYVRDHPRWWRWAAGSTVPHRLPVEVRLRAAATHDLPSAPRPMRILLLEVLAASGVVDVDEELARVLRGERDVAAASPNRPDEP